MHRGPGVAKPGMFNDGTYAVSADGMLITLKRRSGTKPDCCDAGLSDQHISLSHEAHYIGDITVSSI